MSVAISRFFRNQRVELVVALLILLSVVALVVEAMLPLDHPWQPRLLRIGEVFTALFAAELIVRYAGSTSTSGFLLEYWLDILAVAPLLRPLRFLRFLRLLRLFRASVILHRRGRQFLGTLTETSGEYFLLAIFLFTAIILAAIGIMQAEGHLCEEFRTFGSALWWTVLSMAAGQPTDRLPSSNLGKVLTLFVILSGATVFAMFTGIVSAVMVERLRRHMDDRGVKLEDLSGHIVICGWNRSANLFLRHLQMDPRHGQTPIAVVAEFGDREVVDLSHTRRESIFVVRGDFTKVSVLEKANIRKAAVAILLADQVVKRSDQDRDARSVLAALTIEKVAHGIFTCVELLNSENEEHLKMAGVEEILIHDVFQAHVLAAACLNRGLGKMVRDLFSKNSPQSFFTCPVPSTWVDAELSRVFTATKRAANVIIVGVVTPEGVRINPPLTYRIAQGDRLIVVADREPDLASVPLLQV